MKLQHRVLVPLLRAILELRLTLFLDLGNDGLLVDGSSVTHVSWKNLPLAVASQWNQATAQGAKNARVPPFEEVFNLSSLFRVLKQFKDEVIEIFGVGDSVCSREGSRRTQCKPNLTSTVCRTREGKND